MELERDAELVGSASVPASVRRPVASGSPMLRTQAMTNAQTHLPTMQFLVTFLNILDLLAILPYYIELVRKSWLHSMVGK